MPGGEGESCGMLGVGVTVGSGHRRLDTNFSRGDCTSILHRVFICPFSGFVRGREGAPEQGDLRGGIPNGNRGDTKLDIERGLERRDIDTTCYFVRM